MLMFHHCMYCKMKKICWEPLSSDTPHGFEFSDSVSEALRSPVALEEDRLPDSLSLSQVEVEVANVIDAHPGK